MDLYRSAGIVARQVAEIIVTGPDRRGTGYLLSPSLILTAAHVVDGASSIKARFEARSDNEWSTEVSDVWSDTDLDAAILSITPRLGTPFQSTGFGRLGATDSSVSCSAVGFPWFKIRQEDSKYRDAVHITGKIAALSNPKEGTLELSVHPPELRRDSNMSPWEGMSGAAVFCGDQIVGIIAEHHPRDGLGRLTASRVDHWFSSSAAEVLRRLLGAALMPTTADDLPDVAQPQWSRDLNHSLQSWAQAERLASAGQPYQLIDAGVPELASSYVERQGIENGREKTSLSDVLSRHRHVLVEAPAGIGKSSLTYHLAQQSAEMLLASLVGPGLPANASYIAVRIPARDLAAGRPLPSAIADSVRRRLGEYLSDDIVGDQFGMITPGGLPWLIMVDGLDEIVDAAQRRKTVTAVVSEMARPSSPYRWLVTTRPMTDRALETLRQTVGVASFALEVFNDLQLSEMAMAWLRDGDGASWRDDVEEFLNQARSNLQELIRVPLLTAVALLLYRNAADVGLPTTRPGLYEALVTYFLNGRGQESERQQWFIRLVNDAGGTSDLATWLYSRRSEILNELATQTLLDGQPTIARAIAWIKASAEHIPGFMRDWNAIVGSMLASTGLLTLQSGNSLAWIHQTVPEYLVARSAAESLTGIWPPGDLDTDDLLRIALADGVQSEQAVLTIACGMVLNPETSGRVFNFLLTKSDDYDYLLKYHNPTLLIDDDSYNLDHYAMLAGRLLGHGIHADGPLPQRVIRRLLYRARSIFHPQEYCGLVAVQPGKHLARPALDEMIADRDLPIVVRAGAVAAIARIFGFTAAADALEPLMEFGERVTWARQRGETSHIGQLPDGRLAVAEELAQLGEPAREIVTQMLERARIPSDDETGQLVAAECAAKINDVRRLRSLLSSFAPGERSPQRLDFVPLMIKAGMRSSALKIVDQAMTSENSSSAADVAQALLSDGESELAVTLARLGIEKASHAGSSYEVLAAAGYTEEVIAALRQLEPHHTARLDVPAWVAVAQALRRNGLADVVLESADLLLHAGIRSAEVASVLIDIGDDRGHAMMRVIAGDSQALPAERYAAASYLIGTSDRELGVEALLAIPQQPGFLESGESRSLQDHAEGTARSLALVGETEAAVDVLCRLITARKDPDSRIFRLLCRLNPDRGIEEINARLGVGNLSEWTVMKLLMAKASALKSSTS